MKGVFIRPKTPEFEAWARSELKKPYRDARSLITIAWVGDEIFIHHPRLTRTNEDRARDRVEEQAKADFSKKWPDWSVDFDYEVRVK